MFYFVPLAGAGWIMAHGDVKSKLIGELLKVKLPSAIATSVAATPIGAKQKGGGLGVMSAPEELPPPPHTLDRELGRVVAHADVDKTLVALKVVGPVGDRRAEPERGVVIDVDLHRIAPRTPGYAAVLERPDPLFFLGVTERTGA